MKPSKQSSERFMTEIDDILQEFALYLETNQTIGLDRKETLNRIKNEFELEIDKARSEERERFREIIKRKIKPSSDHCPQCRSIVDGWNLALETLDIQLNQLSITKSK